MMVAKLTTAPAALIAEKGFGLLAGLTNEGEMIELFLPARPSPYKVYRCDNKFHLDLLRDCLDEETFLGHLCLISGKDCRIYRLSDKTRTLLTSLQVDLVKRQRKGGQSSVRFARLAEESRHNYVVRVADKLLPLPRPIVIDGSREMCTDLYNYLVQRGGFYLLPDQITPEQYLLDLSKQDETKIVADILTDLTSPRLVFGPDEVRRYVNRLETIVVLGTLNPPIGPLDENYPPEKTIIVSPNTSPYGQIALLGGVIGWLYAGERIAEDEEKE